ncbi:MAG: exodeoxyribonuclease VII large subunit [Pseudomonadota bacterium]
MRPITLPIEAERDIYTVSRLNRETRDLLSDYFPSIWVEGEISNLAAPTSGHLYFTLKDPDAQIRCAMFRMHRRGLEFIPENGKQVLAKAQVSLYEPRGDFQLIVEYMEEAGDGALRRAFERLKQKLSSEGLFDPRHKKTLPRLPNQIGVISSPTGAALRDVLTVLKRRFPAIPVIIYPTAVQGANAPAEIVKAIAEAGNRDECDVLILTRGGGSLEDLWAFNDEAVAKAIFRCGIPVVTGIGHEIDFTVADFVADVRAPTPSAAAETVSPDRVEWLAIFERLAVQIAQLASRKLVSEKKNLSWLEKRLEQAHPGKRLLNWAQRLDELELRIVRSIEGRLSRLALELNSRSSRLHRHHPGLRLNSLIAQQQHLHRRLQSAITRALEKQAHALSELGRALETVSPLATLSRGYSIVYRLENKKIIRGIQDTAVGDAVEAQLAHGRLICRVEETLES